MREQLAQLTSNPQMSTSCDATMSELQSANRTIAELHSKLKEVAYRDKELEFLQEDHRMLQEEMRRREQFVDELETTVIEQRYIIDENEREIRRLSLNREESCRTEETC